MDMKIEVVMLPVSDIDRAKAFYADTVGFHLDHDVRPNENMRIVQLTPPGSACSIVLGSGAGGDDMKPGSIRGVHLVVGDAAKAREVLLSKGVVADDVIDAGGGVKFFSFQDPDGNVWIMQEMAWRKSEFGEG